MKDQYAGDTPDFGKFALLRSIAGINDDNPRLRLGVNWYYTVDVDPNDISHGHRRSHAKDRARFHSIDPHVWKCLEPIQKNRSVAALESSDVLPPDTLYHSDLVPLGPPRDKWFKRGVLATKDADLVFFDPDTGFEPPKMKDDRAQKYALYSELAPYTMRGQTVIVYQQQTRDLLEVCVSKIANRIRQEGDFDGHIEAIKFGSGGSVVYFIMCATDHRDLIVDRLDRLLERGPKEYVRVTTDSRERMTDVVIKSTKEEAGMRVPNYVPLSNFHTREEDFNKELSQHLHHLGVGIFQECETEATVGTRRADIVARGDDGVLVLECQFGKADWDHWGRLEAYARLKDASTAALVAEEFEDLMKTTCELRNADSEIGWHLIQAKVTENEEYIFQTIEGPKIEIQTERAGKEISEFWIPIREKGFFVGKPLAEDDNWIAKSVGGVEVVLFAYKKETKVEVIFPIARIDERDAFLTKLDEFNLDTRETPRSAIIKIPLLDVGRNSPDRWDEMREMLISTGTEVYEMLTEQG